MYIICAIDEKKYLYKSLPVDKKNDVSLHSEYKRN